MSRLVGGKPVIEIEKDGAAQQAVTGPAVGCVAGNAARRRSRPHGPVGARTERLNSSSELLPLPARWDHQVLAILGDGAAGDLDALTGHLVDDFFV